MSNKVHPKYEVSAEENTGEAEFDSKERKLSLNKDLRFSARFYDDQGQLRDKRAKKCQEVCVIWLDKARSALRPLLATRVYKSLQVVSLIVALFGGSIWTLADVIDDPGLMYLDATMLAVTAYFLFELVSMCIAETKEYFNSTFFWLDILGTLSMVFEISFLLGESGMNTSEAEIDAAWLKLTRGTKVAARAGRLSKVLKVLAVLNMHKRQKEEEEVEILDMAPMLTVSNWGDERRKKKQQPFRAKKLSKKVTLVLSTKVSLLTVTLVLVVPSFSIGTYPEQDLSMHGWTERLVDDYQQAYRELERNSSLTSFDLFQSRIQRMVTFYEQETYIPFKIDGFREEVKIDDRNVRIPFQHVLADMKEPRRATNIRRISLKENLPLCPSDVYDAGCIFYEEVHVYWDFTEASKVSAFMYILMICFIVVAMVGASANVGHTIDQMVVRPIEGILQMVRSEASKAMSKFGLEEDDGNEEERPSETVLLASIFRKLARLAEVSHDRVRTQDDMAALDAEGKGVMVDMMHVRVQEAPASTDEHMWLAGGQERRRSQRSTQGDDDSMKPDEISTNEFNVRKSAIESWNLDTLSLDSESLKSVCIYICFDSHLGFCTGRRFTDLATFARFHSAVKAGYNDKPYHNYFHACDVLQTTYRLVSETSADIFLTPVQLHALFIASCGHDLGHFGFTNPFLVETRHDLALRYNDISPLENMHCARLFQICNDEESNVFANGDNKNQKLARKVCIQTILHTDTLHHMDMVRNISRFYEMNCDGCDMHVNFDGIDPNFQEVLVQESMMFLELFLHLADISNPCKPFPICQAWAYRVIDEFFAQGDEEKRLSIPVGMLNDRSKINRPGSQHGFIVFLVAPLVATAVNIFGALHGLTTQMACNVESWSKLWIEEVSPSEEDVRKREHEIRNLRQTAETLKVRGLRNPCE